MSSLLAPIVFSQPIVNIENLRHSGEIGEFKSVGLSLNGSRGNEDRDDFKLNLSYTKNNDNIESLITLSHSERTKDDVLEDKSSFFHSRLLFKSDKSYDYELYVQSSKNPFQSYKKRDLLGFGMRFDLTISDFAHQIYFKKKLDVYDPYTWRPYCHVEDLSNAIIKVILAKKNLIKEQVFNVGVNNNNFTKKKIVEEILKFKNNTKINYLSKGSDPRNYRVDFSKIKKKLNFKCKWTVADGIKELLVCFKKEIFKNVKKQGNYNIIKKII